MSKLCIFLGLTASIIFVLVDLANLLNDVFPTNSLYYETHHSTNNFNYRLEFIFLDQDAVTL